MDNLRLAIDEIFLVDARDLPNEALKTNIERFSRATTRLNASLIARLDELNRRRAVTREHHSTGSGCGETEHLSDQSRPTDHVGA